MLVLGEWWDCSAQLAQAQERAQTPRALAEHWRTTVHANSPHRASLLTGATPIMFHAVYEHYSPKPSRNISPERHASRPKTAQPFPQRDDKVPHGDMWVFLTPLRCMWGVPVGWGPTLTAFAPAVVGHIQ